MTVKKWLMRGRELNDEIALLQRMYDEELLRATAVTRRLSQNRVQESRKNVNEESFVAVSDYGVLLRDRIKELSAVKAEIFKAVNNVEDGTCRRLLMLRYLEFKKWEQIALDMNYDVRSIHRLHNGALRKVTVSLEWGL